MGGGGVMWLLIPLAALGTWAGRSQHGIALRTRPGCRVQSCKGLSPPWSLPTEAGGLRWLLARCTALALAVPQLPAALQRAWDHMSLQCHCDAAAKAEHCFPPLSRLQKGGWRQRGSRVHILKVQWGGGGGTTLAPPWPVLRFHPAPGPAAGGMEESSPAP